MDSGKIQEYVKQGKSYLNGMNLYDTWQKCISFKEGNQWPAATEKTKNLPRPVINIIKFVIAHITASILSEPTKIVYSTEDDANETTNKAASLFTEYAEIEAENLEQSKIDKKVVKKAALLGSGIVHYYMDNDVIGGHKRAYKGRMKGELLSPKKVFVGNPQEQDIQKQPYVCVNYRDLVENVKAEAKINGTPAIDITQIVGDKDTTDSTSDSEKFEIEDKTTVTACYWKENGTIHLMKICGNIIIKPPVDTEHKLYPIAWFTWEDREDSLYGISEAEGMINNQKAINFMTAMDMMANQLTGMPKLMLKGGYVQNFNNDPATPIIDNNPSGWSAQYLTPGVPSGKGQELTNFLMDNTKVLSGATETSTGELAKNSQMNYSAIVALQKAASIPIDDIKDNYHAYKEQVARIWLEFWTINYKTEIMFKGKDETGSDIEKLFRGSDYKDINLRTKVDVGASSEYSEMIVMASLDKLRDKGDISLQQYLENAPDTAIPFKEKLLKDIENQPPKDNKPIPNMSISIAYKDMPLDAQQQLLSWIGIQSQSLGLNPEEMETLKILPPDKQALVMQQLQNNMVNQMTPQM